MNIETKLNIGDPIWFISNHKAISSCVRGVEVKIVDKEKKVTYLCGDPFEESPRLLLKVEELHGYLTRDELIKTL